MGGGVIGRVRACISLSAVLFVVVAMLILRLGALAFCECRSCPSVIACACEQPGMADNPAMAAAADDLAALDPDFAEIAQLLQPAAADALAVVDRGPQWQRRSHALMKHARECQARQRAEDRAAEAESKLENMKTRFSLSA